MKLEYRDIEELLDNLQSTFYQLYMLMKIVIKEQMVKKEKQAMIAMQILPLLFNPKSGLLTNCSDPYDEELKYHRELLWHREEGEQRIGGMNVITAFFMDNQNFSRKRIATKEQE